MFSISLLKRKEFRLNSIYNYDCVTVKYENMNHLIFSSADGNVYVINASTEEKETSFFCKGGYPMGLYVYEEYLYVSTGKGCVSQYTIPDYKFVQTVSIVSNDSTIWRMIPFNDEEDEETIEEIRKMDRSSVSSNFSFFVLCSGGVDSGWVKKVINMKVVKPVYKLSEQVRGLCFSRTHPHWMAIAGGDFITEEGKNFHIHLIDWKRKVSSPKQQQQQEKEEKKVNNNNNNNNNCCALVREFPQIHKCRITELRCIYNAHLEEEILSTSTDGTIGVWAIGGILKRRIEFASDEYTFCVLPCVEDCEQWFFVGAKQSIFLCNVWSGCQKKIETVEKHIGAFLSLVFVDDDDQNNNREKIFCANDYCCTLIHLDYNEKVNLNRIQTFSNKQHLRDLNERIQWLLFEEQEQQQKRKKKK